MKVYELIQILKDCPAGSDVLFCNRTDNKIFRVLEADRNADPVAENPLMLIGRPQ